MLVNGYLLREGSFFRITRTLRPEDAPIAVPVVLQYHAEGNANVVYRVVLFGVAPSWISKWSPLSVENVVLRLSKQKNFITSTIQRKLELEKRFSFIPKNYLMEQKPVLVEKDVIEAINRDLLAHERSGRRPASRCGDPVTLEDNHGMFLTDMTAMGVDTVLEFKPKWLAQSPNAPADSVRCRTCALRARRQAMKKTGLTVCPESTWCPLALVSGDKEERQRAAAAILKTNQCDWIFDGATQLANLFAKNDLLGLLKQHQIRLDPHGILESLSEGKDMRDLRTAMTLRDCTLFITTCNSKFDKHTEMKLADLDLKASLPETVVKYADVERMEEARKCSFADETGFFYRDRNGDGIFEPDSEMMVGEIWTKAAHPGKVAKWADIERSLIEEGWYTREIGGQPETVCVLSRNKDDDQA